MDRRHRPGPRGDPTRGRSPMNVFLCSNLSHTPPPLFCVVLMCSNSAKMRQKQTASTLLLQTIQQS